jgi:hypothetical protein
MTDKTCSKCNTIFKYPSLLKIHLKNSARCKLNTPELEVFINNLSTTKNNDIVCIQCNKKFTKTSSLVFHNKNSKCGKAQHVLQTVVRPKIITQEEIDNITTLEEAKNIIKNQNILISKANIQSNTQPIIPQNITNNNNTTNSNNTINNIQNITINQNITIINPFAGETIPIMPLDDMLKLLEDSDRPEIDILKLVYSDIQNNNFFKYNMGKQDVSYLTSNNSIDTVQEQKFKELIFKNGIELLKSMIIFCIKKMSLQDSSSIYSKIDKIEKRMKEVIYDDDFTNYLCTHFRQNSKNTKKKLTNFVSIINDNLEIKEKVNKVIKEKKILKYNQNKILKPNIPLSKINEKLGDLTSAIELSFDNVRDDFMLNKFEDTCYFKYMKARIDNESNLINDKDFNANFGDYVNLNKRKEQIENSIAKMEAIYTDFDDNTRLEIDIPKIYQTETDRKIKEYSQLTLTNETNQLALTS